MNLFVEFCYNGIATATCTSDVLKVFQELGYIDPTEAKLRVRFQFVPPVVPLGYLVMHYHQNQSQRPNPNLWLGNCPWHH